MEHIKDIMAHMLESDRYGYDPEEDEENLDVEMDPELIAGNQCEPLKPMAPDFIKPGEDWRETLKNNPLTDIFGKD